MRLDKRHPVPIYRQLGHLLKSQIMQGVYCPHQQLPSERELCQQHNLSRMTARRALLELVSEGWAYTCAGKGTFVSELQAMPASLPLVENNPWEQVVVELVEGLLAFDCVAVERITANAMAEFPMERVAMQFFPAALEQVAELRARGDICLQAEHFANNTVRNKLMAFFSACKPPISSRKVVVGCAPGDHHEMAPLLLAISLRQRGYSVIFMGQNMPAQEFVNVFNLIEPDLICFSAATDVSVRALADLTAEIAEQKHNATCIGFGGQAFLRKPGLRQTIKGEYLGETVQEGIGNIIDLVPV